MAEDKKEDKAPAKPAPKEAPKKEAPKPAAGAPSGKKVKKPYQIWKLYEVKDGKLIRKNKFSPKAGEGYFMANHKDRLTCGKTYYMEKTDSPKENSKTEDKPSVENKK
tara:strand:+ start:455 stop:778 length:324 start_codon:yes stop_codon:yes gene_type:complete